MSTAGVNAAPKPERVYPRIEPRPGPQVGWGQYILDVAAELLAPKRPPMAPVQVLPPSLPEEYSYKKLSSYVVNQIQARSYHIEASLIHPISPRELAMFCKISSRKMCEIIQMADCTRKWIKEHKAAHLKERPIKILRIEYKLERFEELLSQLVQKLPLSLPRDDRHPLYTLNGLKPPGLKNEGNDCFMNALLQGMFGDPVTYRYIAIHDDQLDRIKFHAYNFRKAFSKSYFRPLLNIAQDIRTLFPEIEGTAQHGAYDAFACLIFALTGKKSKWDSRDPLFKDHREYANKNPLVHKIIRRATYEGIDLNQVKASDLEAFQNGVHVKEELTWCLTPSLEAGQGSQAMEALLDRYFNPMEGNKAHFNFHLNSGGARELEAFHEQSVFEKRPEYLFLNFKRVMHREGVGYYKAPAPFLTDTFFLDSKHVATGEGGEYQIRYFISHTGSVDSKSGKSDGHYVSYRKIGDVWYYASDEEVRVAKKKEVQTALMEGCELLFAGRVDTSLTQEQISQRIRQRIVTAKIATINILHRRDISDVEFYPHSKLIPRVEAMRFSDEELRNSGIEVEGEKGFQAMSLEYRSLMVDRRIQEIESALETTLSSVKKRFDYHESFWHCFDTGHQEYDESFKLFFQQFLVAIKGEETLIKEAWGLIFLRPEYEEEQEFADTIRTVWIKNSRGKGISKKVPTKILKEELQIFVEKSQSLFLNFLNERNLKLKIRPPHPVTKILKNSHARDSLRNIFADLIALEWLQQDKTRLRRFIANKNLPESALSELPLFKTHFDFWGSHYILKNTLVDGACALHALLGEEINGEVRFPGNRDSASARARRHFTDSLTESLNTRPEMRNYTLQVLNTYLNKGNASAEILASSVSEGRHIKRGWVALQKKHNSHTNTLKEQALALWLPFIQAPRSSVLEKMVDKVEAVERQNDVRRSRQEISADILSHPMNAIENLIATAPHDFLSLLPRGEGVAAMQNFREISESFAKKAEEEEKFILSEHVYGHYVKKLNDPNFYYNELDLQLAAYLFNKKVHLIRVANDLVINPDKEGDPLLIQQAEIYFSRCLYDGDSTVEPVDPETGTPLKDLQTANHRYSLALVKHEKEKEKILKQLFEEACKEEVLHLGLSGGISIITWNPYTFGTQAFKSSVRLTTVYFDPLQESPISEGVNMVALPAIQIATGSPAGLIMKSLCVDITARGAMYYGRNYLEDHLEKVGFSTEQIEKMKEMYHKTPVAVRPFLMSTVKYILFRNNKDLHSGYVSGAFTQANHYLNPESPDPEIRLAQATWTSRTIKVICTNDALQEWIVNKLVEKFSPPEPEPQVKELTEEELVWQALMEKFPELEGMTDLEFKEFLNTINRLLKDSSHLMECPEPPPNKEELQEGKKEDKKKQYVERSITIQTEDGPKKLKSRLPTRDLAYEMRELYRQMVNNPYQANLLLFNLQQKALEAGVPFWEIPGVLDFQNTYFQVNGSQGNEVKVYEAGQLVETFKGKNAGKKAIEYVKQRMEGFNTDSNNLVSNYETEIEFLILKYSDSDLSSYSPLNPLSPEQFLTTISDARRQALINTAKDKVDQRLSTHLMPHPEPLSYYYVSEPVYKKPYKSEKRLKNESNLRRIEIYRIEKTDSGEEIRTHIADAPNQAIADEILLLLKDHDSNFNATNLMAYELQQQLKALGIYPKNIFAFSEIKHTYYDFNNTPGPGAAKINKDGKQIYYSHIDFPNEVEGPIRFLRNSINQDKDHWDQIIDKYAERLNSLTPPHITPPSLSGIVDVERLRNGEYAIYIIDPQGRRIEVNRLEGWDMTCFKKSLSNFIANKFSLETQVHEAIKNLMEKGVSLEDIPNLPQLEEATSQNSSHWDTNKKDQQNTELVGNYLATLQDLFPDQYIQPSQLAEGEKQELVNKLNPYVPSVKDPKEHGFWFETWRNIKDGLNLLGSTGLMQGSINIPLGPTSTPSGGSSYVKRSYGRTSSKDYYPALSHTGTYSGYNQPIIAVPNQNILDLSNLPQTHPFLPPPLSFDNPNSHTYTWADNIAFQQNKFLQTRDPKIVSFLYLDLQGRVPSLSLVSQSPLSPERVSPQLRPWAMGLSNMDRIQHGAETIRNNDLVTSFPRGMLKEVVAALKFLVPNMSDVPNAEDPHTHLDRVQIGVEKIFDEFIPVHNPNSIAAKAGNLLGQATVLGSLGKIMRLGRGSSIFYSVVEGGVLGAVVAQADHQPPLKGALIGGALGGGLHKIAGLFFIPKGNIPPLMGRTLPLSFGKGSAYSLGGVLGLKMHSDMNEPYPGIRGVPQEVMGNLERDLHYVVSYTARMALHDLVSCRPPKEGLHLYRALSNVISGNRLSPPIPHSKVYTVEGKVHSNVVFIFINGVNTSVDEALYNAKVISEKLNGYQVHVVHNSTHGLVGDLVDFGYEKMGGQTNIVNLSHKEVKTFLDAGKDVVLFPYSEGNVIAKNAYMHLNSQETSRIEVHGIAVPEIHEDGSLKKVRNYISKNDWVAIMGNFVKCRKAAKEEASHVEFLAPHSWNPLKEHSFMGETNQEALQKSCDDIIDRYGLNDE